MPANTKPDSANTAQPSDGLTMSRRTFRARDGVSLSVTIWTSTPSGAPHIPFVCLPAIDRTANEFQAFAAEACGKRPATVLALDGRGRGQSAPGQFGYRKDCDDLLDMLTALGVQQAHFVGSAYGGLVAMSLAADRPSAVRSLALVDSAPAIDATGLARLQYFLRRYPSHPDRETLMERLTAHEAKQFEAAHPADFERLADAAYAQKAGKKGPYWAPNLEPSYESRLKNLDLSEGLAPKWELFDGLARVPMMIVQPENATMTSQRSFDEMLRLRREGRAQTRHITLHGHGSTPIIAGKLASAVAEFARSTDG
ncbi:MAG: alpha/beta hydrolase [Pseudomonadota bacterium]